MEKTTRVGDETKRKITYEDVVINIIRYLNINDFEKIDRMTIGEYSLLMEGARLKHLDDLEKIHLLAYKIQVAKNTKKQGDKLVSAFPTFLDFYDKKLFETGISSKALDVSADELDIYKLMSKT